MEENIYDFLGLTPKDSEAKVKEELEVQIKKWTNQLTRQAARAKAKLEVLKRFKAELGTNPNMLKEHADKYETLIAQKKQQQEKSIREDAAIYVVNGQIEEAALAELAKKNSAFSKEEILFIIGATIKKKKEFKYKETGSGREMDSTLFKRILEDLAKVKKRDLYDFLCVPANAPSSLIKQICDEKYAENQKRPANDEKTTVNNLVGHCKTQLLDASKRADYDFTCSNQVFADVRSKIERIASGSERIIRPEQYKALLEECTKKGMPYDKAEYMIYKSAEQHKVTIVEPADNSSMQMCRFCGTLNSKGSRVCKSCGLPVIVVCPKCGRESSDYEELRCIKCGFVIGDFPKADTLVKDAQTALKYNNVDEAIRCLESAANIWPNHPKLQEVVSAIKKSQSAIESALSEVKKLCSKHAYYEASTLLGQIGYGKDATLLRKEIESAVNNADALITKAKSISNTNEQIDCYMQALSICSDCAIAKEKLQLTPPTAPANIKAEVKGNIIHIEWSKLQSQYIQYILIRKANGRPSSPKDGEFVCETLNNAVDDTKSEAGVSYYYAVYSKCGDVFSSHAAITTTPALTVVDINPNSISLDVQENQIGFSIPFPNRAKSIEIYRDGTLIKNLTGSSYMDVNLKAEQSYTYKFITIYEDCTQKRHSSVGVTQVIRPMSPPKPVKLVMTEQDDIVKLSWDKPNKGTLYIFESDKMFDILENNKVNIDNIKHRQLDLSGNSYQLRKNFSGVKYFLPITVQGNIGVAGKEVKLVSIIKPSGVSFDRNEKFVLVKWRWDNISSVRIQVQVDNGNVQKYDIDSPASPNYKVDLPQRAKAIKIGVASRIHVGNEVLIGEEITQVISLKAVKINFKEVNSKSFFGILSKDKYSLSIECDSILPCKVELLIAENFPPTNLVNYKTYLTISPNELKPGCILKKEFKYTRIQKGKPVYFRLIAADRELAKQVVIIPETRQLK